MPDNPDTAEPSKHRRWYQFGLRTLLIVVTFAAVACGYVARQWRIVQARNAYVALHRNVYGAEVQKPTWLRRILGDETYSAVVLQHDASAEERATAKALFPEAKIVRINRDPNYSLNGIEPADMAPFPDDPEYQMGLQHGPITDN